MWCVFPENMPYGYLRKEHYNHHLSMCPRYTCHQFPLQHCYLPTCVCPFNPTMCGVACLLPPPCLPMPAQLPTIPTWQPGGCVRKCLPSHHHQHHYKLLPVIVTFTGGWDGPRTELVSGSHCCASPCQPQFLLHRTNSAALCDGLHLLLCVKPHAVDVGEKGSEPSCLLSCCQCAFWKQEGMGGGVPACNLPMAGLERGRGRLLPQFMPGEDIIMYSMWHYQTLPFVRQDIIHLPPPPCMPQTTVDNVSDSE